MVPTRARRIMRARGEDEAEGGDLEGNEGESNRDSGAADSSREGRFGVRDTPPPMLLSAEFSNGVMPARVGEPEAGPADRPPQAVHHLGQGVSGGVKLAPPSF